MDKEFERSTDFTTLPEDLQNRIHYIIRHGHANWRWGWWNDRTYDQLKRISGIGKAGADTIWDVMHPGVPKIPPDVAEVCKWCGGIYTPKGKKYECSDKCRDLLKVHKLFVETCLKYEVDPECIAARKL